MVFEGPLIHHLEVSKQGFVLADLPFKTIWGINTVHSYFTIQNHNSEWFQMVHHEKGTKRRRVKGAVSSRSTGHGNRKAIVLD